MNSYVVGCDGGGTKTAVEVIDIKGNHLDRQVFGQLNLNGNTEQTIRETIMQILNYLRQLPDGLLACKGICIGSAGISNPVARDTLMRALNEGGYKGATWLVGDHETALYGALESPYGIVLIAGTGSICFGRNEKDESYRSGGWGNLIDDEGSGYAIGRDILSAIVRAYDGRSCETILKKLVFEKLHIEEMGQLIQFIYSGPNSKTAIASLAPLLGPALEEKDQATVDILQKACKELSLLVEPVVRSLQLEKGQITFLGSVLVHNQDMIRGVKTQLKKNFPDLKCIKPKHDAAVGAALMALHHYTQDIG